MIVSLQKYTDKRCVVWQNTLTCLQVKLKGRFISTDVSGIILEIALVIVKVWTISPSLWHSNLIKTQTTDWRMWRVVDNRAARPGVGVDLGLG